MMIILGSSPIAPTEQRRWKPRRCICTGRRTNTSFTTVRTIIVVVVVAAYIIVVSTTTTAEQQYPLLHTKPAAALYHDHHRCTQQHCTEEESTREVIPVFSSAGLLLLLRGGGIVKSTPTSIPPSDPKSIAPTKNKRGGVNTTPSNHFAATTTTSRPSPTSKSTTTVSSSKRSRSVVVPPGKGAVASDRRLPMLFVISFAVCFSSSMVALLPVQALTTQLDSTQATKVLSAISATAALLEIALSGYVGYLLDVIGRKPVLYYIVTSMVIINAISAYYPHIITICIQKLITTISIGFFFLTSQTILTDIVVHTTTATATAPTSSSILPLPPSSTTTSALVSAAMGQQMALTGLGFLVGIVSAGQLSEMYGLTTVYTISAVIGTIALLLIQFGGLGETQPQKRISTTRDSLAPQNPPTPRFMTQSSLLSSIRLLTRHGSKVRTLGLLLMLLMLPTFMGDFFQLFAKQEWQLSTKSFSTFLALFGTVGIVSNTAGSVLVKRWGIKTFTTVAILSRILTTTLTIVFGYKGSMIGLMLGVLGSAQAIGIVAALIAEGTQSGLPQGEMAGERASLIAVLKVVGPILYSGLYLQGRQWMQTSYLPFIFNIGLSLVALIMTQLHV